MPVTRAPAPTGPRIPPSTTVAAQRPVLGHTARSGVAYLATAHAAVPRPCESFAPPSGTIPPAPAPKPGAAPDASSWPCRPLVLVAAAVLVLGLIAGGEGVSDEDCSRGQDFGSTEGRDRTGGGESTRRGFRGLDGEYGKDRDRDGYEAERRDFQVLVRFDSKRFRRLRLLPMSTRQLARQSGKSQTAPPMRGTEADHAPPSI